MGDVVKAKVVFNAQIEYPTKRPNFAIVRLGAFQYAFSYETIVAFRKLGKGWMIRKRSDKWSHTTKQHLAYLRYEAGSLVSEELPEDKFLIELNILLSSATYWSV